MVRCTSSAPTVLDLFCTLETGRLLWQRKPRRPHSKFKTCEQYVVVVAFYCSKVKPVRTPRVDVHEKLCVAPTVGTDEKLQALGERAAEFMRELNDLQPPFLRRAQQSQRSTS